MATVDYVDRIKLGSDTYTISSNSVIDTYGENETKADVIYKSGNLINVTYVTFSGGNWTQSGNYWINSKSTQGITAADEPLMCGLSYPSDCSDTTRKLIQKAVGCIVELETGSGIITIKATRQPPNVDITIALRGLKSSQ